MLNRMLQVAPGARRLGVLILLCVAATAASAQWAWRDENGRPVYSDQPPPAGVKPSDILRQPQVSSQSASDSADAAQPTQAAPPAAPAPVAPPAPKAPTMAEREQEFQKRMKEQSEAEKKVAESEERAEKKTAECERARGYIKSLDENVRLIRTNPDGSRELMDEDARTAEGKRMRDYIEANCN